MNGKILAGGLVGFAVIFGAALWYNQNTAYYRTVTDVTEVSIAGTMVPVKDYQGIDADTSPLKLRACFIATEEITSSSSNDEEAVPLIAPRWFECFDAEQIGADLKSGAAFAALSEFNVPFGFSTYAAFYPDGRGFMWRQLNSCGTAEFSGDPLPEGCDQAGVPASKMSEEASAEPTVSEPPTPRQSTEPASEPEQEVETAALSPEQPEAPVLNLTNVTPELTLVPIIGTAPEPIDAAGLTAKEDSTNPLTLHGCFRTEFSFGLLTETFEVADDVEASEIMGSLPCFDADTLNDDLTTGYAVAFWSKKNTKPGVDRVIAVYDDGNAFVWHQKNNEYAE